MKTGINILLVLVVIFSLTACGIMDKVDDAEDMMEEAEDFVDDAKDALDEIEEDALDSIEESDVFGETDEGDKDNVENDENDSSNVIDETLTGEALINSINVQQPKNYKMVTQSVMVDMETTTMTNYVQENNYRIEIEAPYGHQVMIYNADEGVTYQYNVGDSIGYVIYNDMGMDADLSMDMGFDTDYTYEDDWGGADNVIINAEVRELNGEKVIYMETGYNDADYSIITYTWVSMEYGIPLKYEYYEDEQLISSMEVIEFEVNKRIDDSVFMPPSDIEFQDFSF